MNLPPTSYPKFPPRNLSTTPTPDPAMVVYVSSSMSEPASVIPSIPAQIPLSSSVISTAEPVVVIPLTAYQVPLSQSVVAYNRINTTHGGSSGHSACALIRQQARNYLMHLFLLASITGSPTLVEAVVARYTTISRFCAATCADLKGVLLQDGTTLTLDDVDNLLSLVRYAGLYIRS